MCGPARGYAGAARQHARSLTPTEPSTINAGLVLVVSEQSGYIEQITTMPLNGLVADPMICSGTTAIAAERTRRRWLGCEIDARIASVASKRIKEERRRVDSGESRKGPKL